MGSIVPPTTRPRWHPYFSVTFGINKIRELLKFPQAGAREGQKGFDEFDKVDELVASMVFLGYKGDLMKYVQQEESLTFVQHLIHNPELVLTRKNWG